MYHFVKFNNTWYLKPEKLEDVIEHFKKFCGREFEQGFNDFKDNVRHKLIIFLHGGGWAAGCLRSAPTAP